MTNKTPDVSRAAFEVIVQHYAEMLAEKALIERRRNEALKKIEEHRARINELREVIASLRAQIALMAKGESQEAHDDT